jgi:hypothetical protein
LEVTVAAASQGGDPFLEECSRKSVTPRRRGQRRLVPPPPREPAQAAGAGEDEGARRVRVREARGQGRGSDGRGHAPPLVRRAFPRAQLPSRGSGPSVAVYVLRGTAPTVAELELEEDVDVDRRRRRPPVVRTRRGSPAWSAAAETSSSPGCSS